MADTAAPQANGDKFKSGEASRWRVQGEAAAEATDTQEGRSMKEDVNASQQEVIDRIGAK